MWPRWHSLTLSERATYEAIGAFLKGRLQELASIEWALTLKPHQVVERAAVLDLIDNPPAGGIAEPWLAAWRLVEEHWAPPVDEDTQSLRVHRISERVQSGEKSGLLVTEIVRLVAPILSVQVAQRRDGKRVRHPRSVGDILHSRLTSGKLVSPVEIRLGEIEDVPFLSSLARGLEHALECGLDTARRFGWRGNDVSLSLGSLERITFLELPPDEHFQPDEFHEGVAPCTKLLYAVVARLAEREITAAKSFVERWRGEKSPLHQRLWAALAANSALVPADQVCEFLLGLNDYRFWYLYAFPEVAELRARRFNDLDAKCRRAILKRLHRGPPTSLWRRPIEPERLSEAKRYWIARELRRFQIAGFPLAAPDEEWLQQAIVAAPDLAEMSRVEEVSLSSVPAGWLQTPADNRFDSLSGLDRLSALEAALSRKREGWNIDPAGQASEWIGEKRNALLVLADLEVAPDGGSAFPEVWDRFGWRHRIVEAPDATPTGDRDLKDEAARVVALLELLSDPAASKASDGIATWLSEWRNEVVQLPNWATVWLRHWPYAVDATNAQQESDAEPNLNTIISSSGEPKNLDTLNTPTGKMVGAFFAGCPKVVPGVDTFPPDAQQTIVRDAIAAEGGRAGLIGKHRLLEAVSYFLNACPAWTEGNLLPLLKADTQSALALWEAVSRRGVTREVIAHIGDEMIRRAMDPRLGREVRRRLAFRIVVECLHAFWERRDPAVAHAAVQQMIRGVEEEVRAHGAEAVQRFVNDVSAGEGAPSPEALFRDGAAPFLRQVWPQERSLATPSISKAFADLPSTANGEFAAAVRSIERFLVPFECWSLIEYGLFSGTDEEPKLNIIDNGEKASALLRLLDLTIGTSETARVPYDLSRALERVRVVEPRLADTPTFRRLSTAARM